MEFNYDDNIIFITDDDNRRIAEITFPEVKDGLVSINHTYVDDSLRGQGIAGKLVSEAYDSIKKQEKKAILTCPYAVEWFEQHPENKDIIEE